MFMKGAKMDYRFRVKREINLFYESIQLMYMAAKYEGNFDAGEFHLVKNVDRFTKSPEEIDEEFADVREYLARVFEEAVPLMGDHFWKKLAEPLGSSVFDHSFLSAYALSSPNTTTADLSYEEFMRMQLSALGTVAEGLEMGSFDSGTYGNSSWKDVIDIHWEDIFQLLSLMQISDEVKLTYLSIFADSQGTYERFLDKMTACEKIIRKHLPLVKDRLETSWADFEEGTYDDRMADLFSLDEFLEASPSFIQDRIKDGRIPIDVWIGPCSYATGSLGAYSQKGANLSVFFGLLFFALDDYSTNRKALNKERFVEKTKALGDSLRFDILQILQERPHYVKELAERLNISSPSLSHHLRILFNAGFIHVMVDEQRAYYKINYETFDELAHYFQSIERKPNGKE